MVNKTKAQISCNAMQLPAKVGGDSTRGKRAGVNIACAVTTQIQSKIMEYIILFYLSH